MTGFPKVKINPGLICLAAPKDSSMQYILVIPDASIILNNLGPLTFKGQGIKKIDKVQNQF